MPPEAKANEEPPVLLDIREQGKVYVITLNRPERLNAITAPMMWRLRDILEEYRDNKEARVAILTGAGRAFCAGRDLKESAERMTAIERGELTGPMIPGNYSVDPLAESIGLWKPVIAAINGWAVAGGFMIAMQCDIRIASETAKVGMGSARFNRRGGSWMAPITRQLSLGNALELALWGDTQWTAQRAYEAGWVQRVVPPEQLMDCAMEYAMRAIDMAPQAVRNFKQAIYRGFYLPAELAKEMGSALDNSVEGMQDTVEGARAFAEKRKPNYIDA